MNIPENIHSMSIDKAQAILLYGYESVTPDTSTYYKKGHKYHNKPGTILVNDYEKLLIYLLSEHAEVSTRYLEDSRKSNLRIEPPITKIAKVKEIWEEILPHRELIIGGGKIEACTKNANHTLYNASELSDGERAVFYLIGQCLSAKKDNILIVDEPGLYLHKSIQYALWDRIEKERADCTFVYLTHDTEFAASRIGYKKLWLKDYDGTNWELVDITDEGVLPEELLFEICGSRKKILLVEGENSSYDVKLYKNVFNDFLVKPCGGCESVIAYTKALRSNPEFHQLEVFGLIDKDRRTLEEINSLEEKGIYVLKLAEVENLFVIPEILKIVANKMCLNYEEKISEVKEFVMGELQKELLPQIADRAEQELKYKLSKATVNNKSKDDLKKSYDELINSIDGIFDEIRHKFNTIISEKNYEELLAFYNRRTIASRIGPIFGLLEKELPDFVTRLLQTEENIFEIKQAIKKYFPAKLAAFL